MAHAFWNSTVEALWRRPGRAFGQLLWEQQLLLAGCVLLSTVIVWGFRFQPGLDLPQHAQLFGVLAHFHDPKYGAGAFYDLQLITPYLLTYVVGVLLTKVMGAVYATKTLLWLIALATPYTLLRWLSAVGGEKGFAFWGFVLAFGYPYVWGFTSFGAALPVAFLCMEAWTRASSGSPMRRVLALAGLMVALFFTHAITFILVALALGLSTLSHPRTAFFRRSLALLAPFLVSVAWYAARGAQENGGTNLAPDATRFSILFGAEFHIFEAYWAGAAGLAMVVVMVAITRPVPTGPVERWLPAALAFVGFFSLPNFMMGTAFVGHRFIYLAHAFAPAAFMPTVSARARRWVPITSGVLTVLFLVTVLVRVVGLNRELYGLSQLAAKLPPGADLQSRVPQGEDDSEWFGQDHFVNSFAWLTSEGLGMVADHARFFQLPVVRAADVPFVAKYGYVVSRGPQKLSGKRKRDSLQLVANAERWALYRDPTAPPLDIAAGTVVRYGQGWGTLRVDHAVSGSRLALGGRSYEKGLGTHAHSLIQLRPGASGQLSGACGLDDAAESKRAVVCSILDHRERVLAHAVVGPGAAPASFEVPVRKGEIVYLKAIMADWTSGAHKVDGAQVDWVDLEIHER